MPYNRKDSFYARAKASGYRSRAAYKLSELAQRYQLIRSGDRVVDLGAWPGGWLQVAAQLAGPSGLVVGVDLQPIQPLTRRVSCIVGDVCEPRVQEEILRHTGGPIDVLLSDMASKLSGVQDRDAARAATLANTTIHLSEQMLKADGRLLMKLFMSSDTQHLVAAVRSHFQRVKLTHAAATRKRSAELYLVAHGFRGHMKADSQ